MIVVEQPRQPDAGKKVILGGHMAAAEHHKAALGQQGAQFVLIAGVAGNKIDQGQVRLTKALQEHTAHLVVLLVGRGVGGDGKTQNRVVRPDGPQICHEVIACVQNRNVRPRLKGAAAGAAGKK